MATMTERRTILLILTSYAVSITALGVCIVGLWGALNIVI